MAVRLAFQMQRRQRLLTVIHHHRVLMWKTRKSE
jgi:hypothetical protein